LAEPNKGKQTILRLLTERYGFEGAIQVTKQCSERARTIDLSCTDNNIKCLESDLVRIDMWGPRLDAAPNIRGVGNFASTPKLWPLSAACPTGSQLQRNGTNRSSRKGLFHREKAMVKPQTCLQPEKEGNEPSSPFLPTRLSKTLEHERNAWIVIAERAKKERCSKLYKATNGSASSQPPKRKNRPSTAAGSPSCHRSNPKLGNGSKIFILS